MSVRRGIQLVVVINWSHDFKHSIISVHLRMDLLNHSVFDSCLYCITSRDVESRMRTDVLLHIPTYKSGAVIFCLPTFWLKFRNWSNIGIEVIIIDQSEVLKRVPGAKWRLLLLLLLLDSFDGLCIFSRS